MDFKIFIDYCSILHYILNKILLKTAAKRNFYFSDTFTFEKLCFQKYQWSVYICIIFNSQEPAATELPQEVLAVSQ